MLGTKICYKFVTSLLQNSSIFTKWELIEFFTTLKATTPNQVNLGQVFQRLENLSSKKLWGTKLVGGLGLPTGTFIVD